MTRTFPAEHASGDDPPHSMNPLSNSKGRHDDFRLTVEYAKISTLKPSPHLAKIHPAEQIAQVAESIQCFGILRPVLVGKDAEIVAGHAIYEAAKRLGRSEVPISNVSHLDQASQRAFALADNKIPENSAWDLEAVAREFKFLTTVDVPFAPEITGFSSIEIDFALTKADSGLDAEPEDPLPEPPAQPVAKLGDVWVLGSHKLLVGSALDPTSYVALMGDEKARMVFADPPYNVEINDIVGNGSAKHEEFLMASGEMNGEEFTAFLRSFMQLSAVYTIDGGLNYVCMDWRHMQEVLAAGATAYSELLNLVVWAKTNGGMGSFYRSQHELIFVFKAGAGKHLNNIQLGRYGRNRTNVWSYPGMTSNSRERAEMLEKHPTVKPVVMVADAIRDTSRRGEIILDPFAGSGTTLIAAEKTGRICRAIELDPKFADVIVSRWQAHTGQYAVCEASGATFNELKAQGRAPEAEPRRTRPADHPMNANSAGGEATEASRPQIRERRRPVPTTANNA